MSRVARVNTKVSRAATRETKALRFFFCFPFPSRNRVRSENSNVLKFLLKSNFFQFDYNEESRIPQRAQFARSKIEIGGSTRTTRRLCSTAEYSFAAEF